MSATALGPESSAPFRARRLDANCSVVVSDVGDHAYLRDDELRALIASPQALPWELLAELKSKFMPPHQEGRGVRRLLASRIVTKQETVFAGPSLHILVTTLQCAHSCRYCQVSRSLDDTGFSMSLENLATACDARQSRPTARVGRGWRGFSRSARSLERGPHDR